MLADLQNIARETYLFVTTKLFPWRAYTLDTVAVAGSSVSKALGHIAHNGDIDVFVLFRSLSMPDYESWERACEQLREHAFTPSGTNGTYGMSNWRLGPINLIFDTTFGGRLDNSLERYLGSFDLPQHRAAITFTGQVIDMVEEGPFCAHHATQRTRLPRLQMARERYGVDPVVDLSIKRLEALVATGDISPNARIFRNSFYPKHSSTLYAPYAWDGSEPRLQGMEV